MAELEKFDFSRSNTLASSIDEKTGACEKCPEIEVWDKYTGVDSPSIVPQHTVNLFPNGLGDTSLVVLVGQADAIRQCAYCRQTFSKNFKIPEQWWSTWCRRSNGYFGSEKTLDGKGGLESYQTWFRFIVKQIFVEQNFEEPSCRETTYLWYKLNVFTQWIARTQQTIVLIFDPRPKIRESVVPFLLNSFPKHKASHPFQSHWYFLQELARLQDEAVWSYRNLVRPTEIELQSHSSRGTNNYPELHKVTRHGIHITESLEAGLATLNAMLKEQKLFSIQHPANDPAAQASLIQSQKDFQFISTELSSLLFRSNSNKDRMFNEIQLSFNLLTLFSSNTSIKISKAAQTDSAALKKITFLTLTFLPATFVSAIFSMSFFEFDVDNNVWRISGKLWIYFAIVIPVTCCTLAIWYYWERLFPEESIEDDEELAPAPPKREVEI